MSLIHGSSGTYRLVEYTSEAALEAAIVRVQQILFGQDRIYLDVKKKIGGKGQKNNIPDGYLLDLSGRTPRLFVVENELARHDPIAHVAIQLLEFALAFETSPRVVQEVLLHAIVSQPDAKAACDRYIARNGFRNLDHLLDSMVHGDFMALVIIDQAPDRLQNILAKKLGFTVEILELACYVDERGEQLYLFEPLFAELAPSSSVSTTSVTTPSSLSSRDLDDIDTIVVPAHEDGFRETFLGENRWYAIRIGGTLRPRIKYIAVYQTSPVSAITHIAPVDSIEPWEDTDKFVVNFSSPALPLSEVRRGTRLRQLQNIVYTNYKKLLAAKTLDDL